MTFEINIPVSNINDFSPLIYLDLYKINGTRAFVKTFHTSKVLQSSKECFSYKFSFPGNKEDFKALIVKQGDETIFSEFYNQPAHIEINNFHIVVACRNAEKYIGECISSIIRQTHFRCNIVVIDDNSIDSTSLVVQEIIEKYPIQGIRIIKNDQHRGIGYSKRLGCSLAKPGDIICILDGDDYLTNNQALEKINEEYNKDIRVGCIYTNFYFINSDKVVPAQWIYQFNNKQSGYKQDCVSHFLTFKADVYNLSKGYDASNKFCTDKQIINELACVTNLRYLPLYTYGYRLHQDNIDSQYTSTEVSDNFLRIKDIYKEKDNNMSIIVTHHNRDILPLLKSINTSIVNNLIELIIVTTYKELPEPITSYINTELQVPIYIIHFNEEFNKSKMINLGVLSSNFNRLLFLDCDMKFDEGFIKSANIAIDYSNVFFPICFDEDTNTARNKGYGNCGLMKRDFYRVQGFDEDFKTWGGEDTHFFHKCSLEPFNIHRQEYPTFIHLPHEYKDVWHKTVVNRDVLKESVTEYRARADKNVAFFNKKINEYKKKFSIQS